MNDDMISRLDDRGRAAASGARAAVAELPIPDFDPDLVRVSLDDDPSRALDGSRPGGRRDRRWLAVVGIAAALVVVALGAALVSQAGDDDSAPVDQVGTIDQVRPHVAGWLPEGLVLSHVTSGSRRSAEGGSQSRSDVFGPSPDDPRVLILTAPADQRIEDQIAEGDETFEPIGSVEGRDVFAIDEQPISYVFDEGDQRVAIIAAPGTDEATVLEVAGAVELDGDELTLDDPPGGWDRLGAVDGPFSMTSDMAAAAHHVSYSGPIVEGDDGYSMSFANVSTFPGSPLNVAVLRLVTHSVEDVVVRGHAAIVGRTDMDGEEPEVAQWVVSWEEAPGEVVSVTGVGLSRADVVAMAEDIRPVTSAEWEELSRTAVVTPGPGEELVGSGRFSDGSEWALMARDDGESGTWASLKTMVATRAMASAGSGTGVAIGSDGEPIDVEAPPLPEINREGGDGLSWAYGLLDPETGAAVARVVVVDASGTEVGEAALVGQGDLRGWVVEIPAGLIPPGEEPYLGSEGGGSSSSSSGSDSGDHATETTVLVGTTAEEGDPADTQGTGGLSVVAYAADGTELARQPLP